MAITQYYEWIKPTVGGDPGAWGAILNTLFDGVDSDLNDVEVVADAALPVAGGTMTGNLKLLTQEHTAVDKGASVSGDVTLDCSAGNFFYGTTNGDIDSMDLTNEPAGFFSGVLELTMGGTSSITWGAAWLWPGGVPPTPTANGVDVYVFYTYDAGVTIYVARAMEDLS